MLLLAIAMPAFAGNNIKTKVHVGDWPLIYKMMPVCDRIEVYMNVGYYVDIKDCKKPYKLYLAQEGSSVENFKGCVEFQIKANFHLELGATVKPTAAADQISDGDTSWRAWIEGDNFLAPTTTYKKRTLCVQVKKVELLKGTPNKKLLVAKATILVRPTATPNWWI